MSDVEDIGVGNIAVTVTYRDGTEIQVLPAVQQGAAQAISSPNGESWAQINPKEFSRRLTAMNADLAGGLVPTIKLAKAMIASQVPENRRPSGYHVEALAIAAFDGYSGPRTPKAMTEHLFDRAQKDVLKPIPDITGQSRYVDSSLGSADSEKRRGLSRQFRGLVKRMRSASSTSDWQALFEG
jgi:hypothetical protein